MVKKPQRGFPKFGSEQYVLFNTSFIKKKKKKRICMRLICPVETRKRPNKTPFYALARVMEYQGQREVDI